MAEVYSTDTRRRNGDTDAPRMSPVTPAEDMRTILINGVPWTAVLARIWRTNGGCRADGPHGAEPAAERTDRTKMGRHKRGGKRRSHHQRPPTWRT